MVMENGVLGTWNLVSVDGGWMEGSNFVFMLLGSFNLGGCLRISIWVIYKNNFGGVLYRLERRER